MFKLFSSNKNYKTISPAEAKSRLTDKSVLLIDVRTPGEYKSIRIPDSISVPLDGIKQDILKVAPSKDSEIIVYCQSGARSSSACNELVKMEYTNISNLGGIMSWQFETVSGK